MLPDLFNHIDGHQPFGLKLFQSRPHALFNALWVNGSTGRIIGRGELDYADMLRIAKEIGTDECFMVLPDLYPSNEVGSFLTASHILSTFEYMIIRGKIMKARRQGWPCSDDIRKTMPLFDQVDPNKAQEFLSALSPAAN